MHLSKHGGLWFCSAVCERFCLHSDRPFVIPIGEHNCGDYSKITQLEKQQSEKIYHKHPLQSLPHSLALFSALCASSSNKDLRICIPPTTHTHTAVSGGNWKAELLLFLFYWILRSMVKFEKSYASLKPYDKEKDQTFSSHFCLVCPTTVKTKVIYWWYES